MRCMKVWKMSRGKWFLILLATLMAGAMAAGGIRLYVVMSGSMEPEIPVGSLCIIDTHADYDEVQAGDVIAFWRGRSLVTHRVVAVTPDGLETKGDANERSDGITTQEDNFHGKYVGDVPYIGYGVAICKNPSVQCFLVVWILALLLWELWEQEHG